MFDSLCKTLPLCVIPFLLSASAPAQAIRLTTAPAGVVLGFAGDGTSYTGPLSFSAGAETVSFSTSAESFTTLTAGTNYFQTAYESGTTLLYGNGYSGSSGPLTISFSGGVQSVGFNAEDFNYGDELFSFTAYDGNTELGNFTATGNDDMVLAFLGVAADPGYEITSLLVADNDGNNISVGPLSFVPEPAPTPEPASLALLATGLTTLLATRRRLVRR